MALHLSSVLGTESTVPPPRPLVLGLRLNSLRDVPLPEMSFDGVRVT